MSTVKFDFSKPLLQANSKPAVDAVTQEPLTMAVILAMQMGNLTGSQVPVKVGNWAVQLGTDGTVTLDRADQATFKGVVEKLPQLGAGYIARIINEFEDQQAEAKREADKPKVVPLAAEAAGNSSAAAVTE